MTESMLFYVVPHSTDVGVGLIGEWRNLITGKKLHWW